MFADTCKKKNTNSNTLYLYLLMARLIPYPEYNTQQQNYNLINVRFSYIQYIMDMNGFYLMKYIYVACFELIVR